MIMMFYNVSTILLGCSTILFNVVDNLQQPERFYTCTTEASTVNPCIKEALFFTSG
jgi:hypothetical protein